MFLEKRNVAILDELMELDEAKEVEDWEKMKRISEHYQYPVRLMCDDGN